MLDLAGSEASHDLSSHVLPLHKGRFPGLTWPQAPQGLLDLGGLQGAVTGPGTNAKLQGT